MVRKSEDIKELEIGGISILAGETKQIELQAVRLYNDSQMTIPIYVKRGKKPGPTIFISAAIHGDELNGIEIISRVINSPRLRYLRGTLIAVPIVNGYGMLHQSRYLPDRRDLNRCFPGSEKGSQASRLAHLFIKEIVSKCDYGIDLHTGAIHRSNLPQIRANLDDEVTLKMAHAFGVPVMVNSNLRDGSLRQSAADLGIPMLLFEAGEALRFDEMSIRSGASGVFNVLSHFDMLNPRKSKKEKVEPLVARKSGWVRATDSGLVIHKKKLGDIVDKDEVIAIIKTPLGKITAKVLSNANGIIIGKQNIPLVHEGEAIYHIAYFKNPDDVVENLELMQENLDLNDD